MGIYTRTLFSIYANQYTHANNPKALGVTDPGAVQAIDLTLSDAGARSSATSLDPAISTFYP